jgi:hypothetical protein
VTHSAGRTARACWRSWRPHSSASCVHMAGEGQSCGGAGSGCDQDTVHYSTSKGDDGVGGPRQWARTDGLRPRQRHLHPCNKSCDQHQPAVSRSCCASSRPKVPGVGTNTSLDWVFVHVPPTLQAHHCRTGRPAGPPHTPGTVAAEAAAAPPQHPSHW